MAGYRIRGDDAAGISFVDGREAEMICPNCKLENNDGINWPLEIDGAIMDGGCQMCWEKEIDDKWWRTVVVIEASQFQE